MREVRFFYHPEALTSDLLPHDEALHAVRVLRLSEGDEIFIIDGHGAFHRAVVTMTSAKHCAYSIMETLPQQPTWHGHIHLAIAPTKNMDRMEWMAEKATEVGFDELSLVECRFSERRKINVERIDKVVVSAVKQSRKAWKPIVNDMTPFTDFLRQHTTGSRFICHCYDEIERHDLYELLSRLDKSAGIDTTSPSPEIIVLIGPEGDFSIDEVRQAVAAGWQSVSLGKSRLRTETAGLTAVMMANLAMRV